MQLARQTRELWTLRLSTIVVCVLFAPLVNAAENEGVVIITEIMYHPAEGGQNLEFVEIHNSSPSPVDISGWFFSNGINFTFPPMTFLDPGAYLVVCANQDAIRKRYGIENTIGNWAACGEEDVGGCALANGGEAVELCEEGGAVHTRVRYNDRGRWPAGADGAGHSLALTYEHAEQDDADKWAVSASIGGSPGSANNTDLNTMPVVINEALLLTDGEPWVELYNSSADEIDVSGLYLTDDRDELLKAALPDGSTIPGYGWLALSGAELSLDFTPEQPEDADARKFIALSLAIDPDSPRVIDAYRFEPEEKEKSEARFPDGDEDFFDRAEPTRGAGNVVQLESDIVINEILYHGWDNGKKREFVELFNRSTERTVDISGWKMTRGFNFVFPDGTSVPPQGFVVLARDPVFIRETYGLAESAVFGPDPNDPEAVASFGQLRDDGENVTLRNQDGSVVDRVRYQDGGQWPVWPDGGGSSLELIDANQDNNVASAWDSSDDADKAQVAEFSYEGPYSTREPEFHLLLLGRGISLVDDIKITLRETVFEVLETLVAADEEWRYFKGTEEPSSPRDAWRQPDFDDTNWAVGKTPIGFGEEEVAEGTELADMRENYSSFYVRKEFTLEDPENLEGLVFDVTFDDGFVAYLNGALIQAANMRAEDGTIKDAYDDLATTSREMGNVLIELEEHKELLVAGRNVIALQMHNRTLRGNDAFFGPRLIRGQFVIVESDNQLANGGFESELSVGRPTQGSWLIEGNHHNSGRTTTDPISGAASLKVVATGRGDNKVNRLEATLPALKLRNIYGISLKGKWVVGAPTILTHGHNLASPSFDYPSSHSLPVPENLGTPGSVNSVTQRQVKHTGAANAGPVIDKLDQFPVLPTSKDSVEVSVRIQDSDGIESASLFYWLEDRLGKPGPEQTHEIPLESSGRSNRYRGTLPPQQNRTRVVYYIEARDTSGRVGRFPADKLSRTHPTVLDPEATTQNDSSFIVYRHDVPIESKTSYRVWTTRANDAYLQRRKVHSNDMVEATFIFNDRDLYHSSGVRFSGSAWARGLNRGSYRIRMPKDRPLHGTIKKFNLENHQGGTGGPDGRERLSNYLIQHNQGAISVPYSYGWLVQYQYNDARTGESAGLREHVAPPNTQFIQRWYRNDSSGAFFEMDDRFEFNDEGVRANSVDGKLLYPPFGPRSDGGNKEHYRWSWNSRMDERLDDFSQLTAFAKVLDPLVTRDPEYDELIFDVMNVEEFCRIWAIRNNTDDWDQWGTNRGKNCYIYRPAIDGRWVLFAWDMELSFDNFNSFTPPPINRDYTVTAFQEIKRFFNRPRIRRLYYGILKDMMDHQFNSAFLRPYVTRLNAAGVRKTEGARRNGFVDRRAALLKRSLRSATGPTVTLRISTGDGNSFVTNQPTTAIEGIAPVEMRFVVFSVNGQEAEPAIFSSQNALRWDTPTITLKPGANTVEFFGFSNTGDLLQSVSTTVTFSETPPVIDEIDPPEAAPGDRVRVRGSGLDTGVTVFFGAESAVDISYTSPPTGLEVTVPDIAFGPVDVTVVAGELTSDSSSFVVTPPEVKIFVRGDVDSNHRVSIADAVLVLQFLFKSKELECEDAADADDNGRVQLGDAIRILDYLFLRGAPIAAPFPDPSEDPTDDEVSCENGLTLPQ